MNWFRRLLHRKTEEEKLIHALRKLERNFPRFPRKKMCKTIARYSNIHRYVLCGKIGNKTELDVWKCCLYTAPLWTLPVMYDEANRWLSINEENILLEIAGTWFQRIDKAFHLNKMLEVSINMFVGNIRVMEALNDRDD